MKLVKLCKNMRKIAIFLKIKKIKIFDFFKKISETSKKCKKLLRIAVYDITMPKYTQTITNISYFCYFKNSKV